MPAATAADSECRLRMMVHRGEMLCDRQAPPAGRTLLLLTGTRGSREPHKGLEPGWPAGPSGCWGLADHVFLALVSDCGSALLPGDREDGSPPSLSSPPASPGMRFKLSLNLLPIKCGRIVITSSSSAELAGRAGKQATKSGDQRPGPPFLSPPVPRRLRGGRDSHGGV